MSKKDSPKRSRRFEVEWTMSAAEVADYLDGISKGLREGAVVLGDATEGFRAALDGAVDIEIEARHGKRKSRIELELTFRRIESEEPEAVASDDGASPAVDESEAATIPNEMSF